MDGYGGHRIGDEFSNKRLVAYFGLNNHKHHTWLWECLLCGSESGPSTISHMRRSQQCMKACMLGLTNPRWKGYEELTGVWLYQYQNDAKKKGRDWAVTPEYLWSIWLDQHGACAYTGRRLIHGDNASLDRIDSSKGYVEGNVQWVHRDINRMKTDFSEDRFIELCKLVASNF